jgi:hypothetical protein
MKKFFFKSIGILFAFSAICFSTSAQINLYNGLVACYPFNGNANDTSGNNHHGTVLGPQLTFDRFGNPSSAYQFDGVDDYIDLGVFSDISLSNNFTISVWAKANVFKPQTLVMMNPDDNQNRLLAAIYFDNSGTPYSFWDFGDIFSNGRLYVSNTSLDTIVWEHYIFSVGDSGMTIYKNGIIQADKISHSLLVDRSRNLWIGGGSDLSAVPFYFDGAIDDLFFLDRQINDLEALAFYSLQTPCTDLNLISGKVYYDFNSNNVFDSSDFPASNMMIQEPTINSTGLTRFDGDYSIYTQSPGTFTINPVNTSNYYTAVPVSHAVIFNGVNEIDSLNDFALQPSSIINDLQIGISPLTAFRPGFYASYNVTYNNVGTTALTPTIVMFLDTSLVYDTSSVIPTTINSDSITWDLPLLAPFNGGSFTVTCVVNSTTPIGTLIDSEVRIEPVAGDTTASDNTASWQVTTTGSYDPNDILVNRSFIETPELNSPPFLNYIIRFQNTGNDTAFNIHIQNQIPIELLETTFELIDASHPVDVNYNAVNRTFTFSFNQVLLPDSNINEPASHGYVEYRMKPLSTLSAGQSIVNNAGIYFDFNAPVLTNDAVTSIISPTSVHAISSDDLKVNLYPVPARNMLTINIRSNNAEPVSYQMFDITGKTISPEKLIPVNSGKGLVNENISFLENGYYLIKFRTGSGDKVLPFLKQ